MSDTTDAQDDRTPADAAIDMLAAAARPATPDEGPEEDRDEEDREEATDRPDDRSKARREARNLRARLRETEAERDDLAARVADLTARADAAEARAQDVTRARVEDVAAVAGMRDPADLWRYGATLGDLLDEDGAVDVAKVGDAVEGLRRDRPHLTQPPRMASKQPVPLDRLRLGATPADAMRRQPPPSFGEALSRTLRPY